jgi:hypothetical protein
VKLPFVKRVTFQFVGEYEDAVVLQTFGQVPDDFATPESA